MSSKIEWTDETWNPTLGCTRVSPGCNNCYAIRQSRIRSGNPHPAIAAAHAGLTEHRDGRLDWTGDVRLLPDRLNQPLRWRRPRRIFVDSLTDLFHDQVPDGFISIVVEMAERAPQHTFQVLTKRHGRMRSLLRRWAVGDRPHWQYDRHGRMLGEIRYTHPWTPPPNLWLGVSVEDQQRADLRIPALLDTPAAVRWISAEPLLGPVDLVRAWLHASDDPTIVRSHGDVDGLDWVVVGGESGPGARPMHPAWARSLRDQCATAGVPFLFKQWGDWLATDQEDPRYTGPVKGGYWKQDGTGWAGFTLPVPDAPAWMLRLGKKAAGRELDGRTHDGYPEVAA